MLTYLYYGACLFKTDDGDVLCCGHFFLSAPIANGVEDMMVRFIRARWDGKLPYLGELKAVDVELIPIQIPGETNAEPDASSAGGDAPVVGGDGGGNRVDEPPA